MANVCKVYGTMAGFFSVFRGTVGTFKLIDEKGMVPFVEWNNTLYNESKFGKNAWEYYFEQPSNLSESDEICEIKNHHILPRQYDSRIFMNQMIKKYVKPKSFILEEVSKFEKLLENNALGVHIRMTDKYNCMNHGEPESGRPVNLDLYIKHIDNYLKNNDCNIFLATDDSRCLRTIKKEFGEIVIHRDAIRSYGAKSIHHHTEGNGFKKGLDVLLDCLILSKCSHMIKGISNVSLCAAFFNLNLTSINLNSIYNNDTREDFINEL